MILVFLGARSPAQVLELTAEQVVLLAREGVGVSHSASLPPGSFGGPEDEAFAVLAKGKIHARRFQSSQEAFEFYAHGKHGLALTARFQILQGLETLRHEELLRASAPPGSDATPPFKPRQ